MLIIWSCVSLRTGGTNPIIPSKLKNEVGCVHGAYTHFRTDHPEINFNLVWIDNYHSFCKRWMSWLALSGIQQWWASQMQSCMHIWLQLLVIHRSRWPLLSTKRSQKIKWSVLERFLEQKNKKLLFSNGNIKIKSFLPIS